MAQPVNRAAARRERVIWKRSVWVSPDSKLTVARPRWAPTLKLEQRMDHR